MYTTANAQRARWAVMWVAVKNGRRKVVRKDHFGDDLASAEALYQKALTVGKPAATLVCLNMGFPPPKDLRSYEVVKKGRSRQTGKIKRVTVLVEPLKELNHQGKIWCPYCRKLRPFVLRKSFKMNGTRVADPRFVCPICGISHRDHNVRFWNPTAAIHMDSAISSMTRRSSRTSTKTKRRRRRA